MTSTTLTASPTASTTLSTEHRRTIPVVAGGGLISSATFTGPAGRAYFDSDGIMQTAAANEARTTYIGGNPYLWIDGAVEEISGRSHDLTNWTTDTTASVAQDAVGLDGAANTGFTVTDSSGAAIQSRENRVTITSGSDTYYAVVAFGHEASPTVYPEANFGISGGTAIFTSLILDRSDGSYSERFTQGSVVLDPVRFGDYWLFVMSITDNASGNTQLRNIINAALNDDGTTGIDATFQGSVKTGVWAVYKNNFSLMPILTTGGTTASIAADVASLTNSVISGLTEGTLYMEIWSPQLTANAARHIAELESDSNNFIRAQLAADGDIDGQITSGGASQAALAGPAHTPGQLHKVALVFGPSGFALYVDGTQRDTGTGTVPSVDTLLIGAGLYGGIKTMNVEVNERSQASAEALTA